ncbi:MAG: helix-turn-helix transcriptional regulator [Desulfovibrio sp.]|nr:helix-turn-helix transcriptional regulator [Desulfovibrio sp.]MBI4960391.1 helix-turn-helix transcriptional regulator [Desulfovibrio sp.]
MSNRSDKKRNFWRIREFLASNGLSMAAVGREVGVSRNLVRETLLGMRNNKKVLLHMRYLGCPAQWLHLPECLTTKKAA